MLLSFFKRAPDEGEIWNWLVNLKNVSMESGMHYLSKDKTSSILLAHFTLLATTESALTILGLLKIHPKMGPVFSELRAYYGCLWMLHLLSCCATREDEAKVSRICGEVDFWTAFVMREVFDSNIKLKSMFICAFTSEYSKPFDNAVKEYINRRREYPIQETGDLLTDNVEALALKIVRAANLDATAIPGLKGILIDKTQEALTLKFLTQFDFANSAGIGLPPSLMKK
jgi:hypothetical protein